MKVSKISWLSKSAEEAEVEIVAGQFSCTVFSHPCNVSVGEKIVEPLHIFSAKNIMLSDHAVPEITKISESSLSQRIVAQLIDGPSKMLAVGEIKLVLEEYLPGGIVEGNFVQFTCARVDLW